MEKRLIFLLLLLSFYPLGLTGNNLQFEHYNDSYGLTQNSVRHILQDKHGFLWLGTFRGLNRFDGYQFKSYPSTVIGKKKFNNDDITALLIDDDTDNMWIGTTNGLSLYQMDIDKLTTYRPQKDKPNSIPDAEIRSVFIDRFKQVWIGTKTKGFGIFNVQDSSFKEIEIEGFDYIKVISEDSKGHIWVGSYNNSGVAQITLDDFGNVKDIHEYNLKNSFTGDRNPYIYFIYEDHKSDIFIGTRDGLFKWDKLRDEFISLWIEDDTVRDVLGTHYNCVVRSPEGKYWLGTLGGLISCNNLEDIVKGDFEWYYSILSDNTSLVDNLVSSLCFDKSGVLWIGTENGLDKCDPFENQFKSLKDISLLIGDKVPRISGFAKTFDNNLIVATHYNGLFLLKDNKFEVLYDKYKEVSSIYSYDNKTFYCGLWNGEVVIFDYIQRTAKHLNVGFEGIPILSFCKSDSGKVIVGSFGEGAIELNINDLSVDKFMKNWIYDCEINKIIHGSDGAFWFATETGILSFDPATRKLKSYTNKGNDTLGLSNDHVRDIFIDQKGRLWAATRLGLNYFDPDVNDFKSIAEPLELRENWITDIVADTSENMWLNLNNNRIARYNPDSKETHIYHVKSGNRLEVFSLSGFYYFDDSHIYLGGKDGIIYFSPKDLKDNEIALPPYITDFRVQNKEVTVGQQINGQVILQEDINESRSLKLNYSNRNFSISFSSPSFVKERYNLFMYKLEGFDTDWNTVDESQRNIQYTNLFFGDYTFKIKSRNSHGYWSEPSTYSIIILPPIWLTYKAFLFYAIVIILIVIVVKRITKRQLRLKHELMLEKVKREKDEKLNREKLRFFTNISHEFRTPLTLILGPVKQLLEQHHDESYNNYQLIYRNTKRLLNLVNQLLDFRKTQEGTLRLKVTHTDIVAYTLNTFNSFKALAVEKDISFNFFCKNNNIQGWIDRDKYDKILYNLLSNAFKFTNEHGAIDLTISSAENDGNFMRVDVIDSGIGIPFEDQQKIFSRFYQAKSSLKDNTGTGIGLALVESLVEVHKGEIWFESVPGQGSVFSLSLPLDRNAYNEDEIFDISTEVSVEFFEMGKADVQILDTVDIKEKLLIIEDNPELRKFLADFLSKYYKVYEAENGKDGLKLCKLIKPLICVVDVMMPFMNGFEFCSNLKNDDEISHIPVILLTALTEDENKIKGYKVGADGYLNKPFDPDLLKVRIDSVIKTRKELKNKFSKETSSDVSIITHSPADEIFMKKLNEVIEDHLAEPDLSVDLLCKLLNVSSSKLYRKLKELTDLSSNEFIRTIRLKKASQLLNGQNYNVSEVSTMVGFNDPLYFSRCFKKQFGVSPSKYIKQ